MADRKRGKARRTPEEAYRYMSDNLRTGRLRDKSDRKPQRRLIGIIIGIALAVLVVLGIGLYVTLSTDPTPAVHAANVDPSTCLDDKGNLPGFTHQVSEKLGLPVPVEPITTVIRRSPAGWRVVLQYKAYVGFNDVGSTDLAIGAIDPRYCTTTVLKVSGRVE